MVIGENRGGKRGTDKYKTDTEKGVAGGVLEGEEIREGGTETHSVEGPGLGGGKVCHFSN